MYAINPFASRILFSLLLLALFPLSLPLFSFSFSRSHFPRPRFPLFAFLVIMCARATRIVNAKYYRRCTSRSPDNFAERPLADKGRDNSYKWRRKIVRILVIVSASEPPVTAGLWRFSIFDEYRGDECGWKVFIDGSTEPFRPCRDTSG